MKHYLIDKLEAAQMRDNLPHFVVGDQITVSLWIREGTKSRIQDFKGLVIARKNRGFNSSFTLRKVSSGEGVEKTFQLHSPTIESIKIEKSFHVRRAKLYFLRQLSGKSARLKEKFSKKSI